MKNPIRSIPKIEITSLWAVAISLAVFGFSAFLGLLIPIIGFNSLVSVLIFFLGLSLIVGLFIIVYFACLARPWALMFFLVISVFLIDATFRRRELSDHGIDTQTILKLLIWCTAIMIAFMSTSNFMLNMFRGDIKWLTMFSLLGLGSTVYSLTPAFTFGAGVAAISYCALAVCVSTHLTERQILYSLLIGILIMLILSLLMYGMGWGMTIQAGALEQRLGGLAGSPNTLGRTASLALLVISVLVFRYQLPIYSWYILASISLALTCLLLSDSRTALVSISIAIGFYFLRKRLILGMIAIGIICITGLLLINIDIPWRHLGKSLARTGQFNEVITLTGRTEIWYATWKAFIEQPMLGYGFGATKVLLPEVYRGYWGFTVTQAHNFMLQTAVTTGIVGLLFALMTLVRLGIAYVKSPKPFPILVLGYLLIYGLTEPGPVGPAPNILTLFWALSLCWDDIKDNSSVNNSDDLILQKGRIA